jgi:uncharacterized membrane protein (DUF485 family)
MGLLLSFLNLLLYIALIMLVAFGIKWVIEKFMGWAIDADVLKWAKILVGLLCLIAIVAWLGGVLGYGTAPPMLWRHL